MENFTTILDSKLGELSGIWNDIKSLNKQAKYTKTALFLDIETTIHDELISANDGEIIAYKKQFGDMIKEYLLTLDDKKVKQIDIVNLINFKVQNSIALYLYTNSKGNKCHLPLGKLQKLQLLSKSQIKKITALYVAESKNEDYLTAIDTAIKAYEDAIIADETAVATLAGANDLKIKSLEDAQKVINHLTRKLKIELAKA